MELETFKITVVPLREKLLAYTLRLAEGRIDVEDVVQDVFLKLWSMREKLDDYQSVEALAFKVTKNKVLDELKRCRTDSLENIQPSALNLHNMESPEKIAEQHDTTVHIKRLIEALPSLQQTIIRMKDIEGYELSEIAEITGTQAEAVRVNLSRARKKIREQLIQLHNIIRI
ncbi:MAG: sigma-70 family RNA polymerase sigma factor [Tannerella sp.]|jgi:RNA polymerase sigma-70 factor (ECF subfamily)|nr:sigma-70 family RNA polymerase sigma factor [Tannerella sp.]